MSDTIDRLPSEPDDVPDDSPLDPEDTDGLTVDPEDIATADPLDRAETGHVETED